MKRKYEFTCSRCGYLAGQIVLSSLSSPAVISVLLCPAPPNIKANCPDRGGVGSRLLCLHRSAWNTGLQAESSKFFLFSVVTYTSFYRDICLQCGLRSRSASQCQTFVEDMHPGNQDLLGSPWVWQVREPKFLSSGFILLNNIF